MSEVGMLLHVLIALICAIELRVSLGNRERMNHLLRDNWRERQATNIADNNAKNVRKGLERDSGLIE